MLRELVEILGVRGVLPVKGIVTARTLYRDTAERALSDIDVRVTSPRELALLIEVARARGYRLKSELKAYRTAVIEMLGVDVDIECDVGPPGVCAIDVATMLARAPVRDDVFGFACAIPELHDHALLLAINVFKDKIVLAHPWQVEDARRVVEAEGFDPARLVEVAREARCVGLVCVVADHLAPSSAGWRDVRAIIGQRPPRRAWIRALGWLMANAPKSIPARVGARLASDDLAMRLTAIATAARYVQEKKAGGS